MDCMLPGVRNHRLEIGHQTALIGLVLDRQRVAGPGTELVQQGRMRLGHLRGEKGQFNPVPVGPALRLFR